VDIINVIILMKIMDNEKPSEIIMAIVMTMKKTNNMTISQ
jgi:hypothetical protein